MMLTIQTQIAYVKIGILNLFAILKIKLQKNQKKGAQILVSGWPHNVIGLNLLDKVGVQILRFLWGIENDERRSVSINLRWVCKNGNRKP